MHNAGGNKIKTVRFGKRIIIPRAEVERLLGSSSLADKWRDYSTFSVNEFAEITGLSRSAAYEAVKAGDAVAA